MKKRIKTVIGIALSLCILLGSLPFALRNNGSTGHVEAAEAKTITRSVLEDKLMGAWMGALWANFTGLPTEFQYINQPGPTDTVDWKVSEVYVTDDDTSMEYTFLHMMEVYGADDITYADMPAEWIYHFQDYIWEGNYYARQLMLQGVLPPQTGAFGFNRTPEAIDAQIECEVFGMVTPGMLENSYGRTKWWMAVVGDGDVLENSAFYSMLVSDAFFSNDIYQSMDRVRSYFNDEIETAKVYDYVKNVYENIPNDWRAARAQIHSMYYNNYNLACDINFASTLLALFYGGGDYKRTVEIGVNAGYDNDCNAATAATILGTMYGYSGLPVDLKEQSGTYYQVTNRPGLESMDVSKIAKRCADQAEVVILGAGGLKNGETYYIYDGKFTPKSNSVYPFVKKIASSNEAWTYNGMQKFYRSEYEGSIGYGSTSKGATAEVKFTGDEVSVVSTTSVNGGSFKLEIDGKNYGTLSLKAEETCTVGNFVPVAYGQILRKVRGLGEGQHTLKLTTLEEGKWHSVDYVEVVGSEDEYYATEGLNYARTPAATAICSVISPLGTGAGGGGIKVINDGVYFGANMHSSIQYDSYLGRDDTGANIPKDFEDYVGYTFSREFTLTKLVFNEGGHWGIDGGWFANGTMRVEVLIGDVWTAVDFDISPEYPNGNDTSTFNKVNEGGVYTLTFNAVNAKGVRLIGTAGGSAKIISCGELEVY